MQKYSPVSVVVTVSLHLHEHDHSSCVLTSLADKESIPTIRCSTCSEWHHRPCVSISENKDQSFVCRRCKIQTAEAAEILAKEEQAKERAEQERWAAESADRSAKEAEQKAKEKAEQERLAAEAAEKLEEGARLHDEQAVRERLKQERKAQEKAEQEILENERAEIERLERERLAQEEKANADAAPFSAFGSDSPSLFSGRLFPLSSLNPPDKLWMSDTGGGDDSWGGGIGWGSTKKKKKKTKLGVKSLAGSPWGSNISGETTVATLLAEELSSSQDATFSFSSTTRNYDLGFDDPKFKSRPPSPVPNPVGPIPPEANLTDVVSRTAENDAVGEEEPFEVTISFNQYP
jgi:hypothetical protein